jgi:hypothetical protein
MTSSLDQLQRHCTALASGPVADVPALRRMLADAWDDLRGDDGGMEPYKLLRPLEEATWTPPVLSFVIERHGSKSLGGTRDDLQHWHVDVEKGTATLGKIGWRQDRPQRERYPVKATAAEVVEAVRKGQKDDRLRWDGPSTVKLMTTKLFPEGSGYRRTVEGQRKAFRSYVAAALTAEGWKRLGNDLFERKR